jgi:hypothetical protein
MMARRDRRSRSGTALAFSPSTTTSPLSISTMRKSACMMEDLPAPDRNTTPASHHTRSEGHLHLNHHTLSYLTGSTAYSDSLTTIDSERDSSQHMRRVRAVPQPHILELHSASGRPVAHFRFRSGSSAHHFESISSGRALFHRKALASHASFAW